MKLDNILRFFGIGKKKKQTVEEVWAGKSFDDIFAYIEEVSMDKRNLSKSIENDLNYCLRDSENNFYRHLKTHWKRRSSCGPFHSDKITIGTGENARTYTLDYCVLNLEEKTKVRVVVNVDVDSSRYDQDYFRNRDISFTDPNYNQVAWYRINGSGGLEFVVDFYPVNVIEVNLK